MFLLKTFFGKGLNNKIRYRNMAKHTKKARQNKFSKTAKKCSRMAKGKKKGTFRACMKRELKK